MQRQQDCFDSSILQRKIEYLWFGSSGRPLVMFPTSGGRYTENEDRELVATLGDYITEGRLQVCCIDSFNDETWGNTSISPVERIQGHDRYDRYLSSELFPMVATRAGRDDTAVYGASMGGYYAVNFAARHPEQVKRCVALSGMFDTHRILDGHWDEQCYFHNPTAFVPNMDDEWIRRLAQVEWVIATGENDSLVEETRNFSDILRRKGIEVHCEIWPGVFGHDWPYWKQHLRRFLP